MRNRKTRCETKRKKTKHDAKQKEFMQNSMRNRKSPCKTDVKRNILMQNIAKLEILMRNYVVWIRYETKYLMQNRIFDAK